MAILNIPNEQRDLRRPEEITAYLSGIGIQYEVWPVDPAIRGDATADDILTAFATQLDRLKSQGGYVTADVIDVKPGTPGLEAMLAKFEREHQHDEDEVRFILEGRGVFHIRPAAGPVVAVEVEAGDLIRVPRGTMHWFNLCPDRRIRAIRLFQDPSGWAPHYTDSGVDRDFEVVCFGASYIPRAIA